MLPQEGDRLCVYWSPDQLDGAPGHWFRGIAKKRGGMSVTHQKERVTYVDPSSTPLVLRRRKEGSLCQVRRW